MRSARIERKTNETEVRIDLKIDGAGIGEIDTGIGFFNHMLNAFTLHGAFDLNITARGDLDVDLHHTVEDVGIALGGAFREALGDKKGISRCGFFIFPMDEAQATVALDLCGRFFLRCDCPFLESRIGEFPTSLLHDFLWGFASSMQAVIHVRVENGRSAHHQIEAVFKALGRALAKAVRFEENRDTIPSTKGAL